MYSSEFIKHKTNYNYNHLKDTNAKTKLGIDEILLCIDEWIFQFVFLLKKLLNQI